MILRIIAIAAVTACLSLPGAASAQTPSPAPTAQAQQSLEEMVAQLRAKPSDQALRDQIIVQVAQMKAKPEIPEEARRAFVQGNAAFTAAQGPADYQRAADRFNEALAITPWWGDVYFNLSKTREQQGEFDLAIRNLKNYLLSMPPIADARAAQDQIYVLEDKKAAAAQRQAAEAQRVADEAARKAADPWSEFEGARYFCTPEDARGPDRAAGRTSTYTITNRAISWIVDEGYTTRSGSIVQVVSIEPGRLQFYEGGWTYFVTPNFLTVEGLGKDGTRVAPPLKTCRRQW